MKKSTYLFSKRVVMFLKMFQHKNREFAIKIKNVSYFY